MGAGARAKNAPVGFAQALLGLGQDHGLFKVHVLEVEVDTAPESFFKSRSA